VLKLKMFSHSTKTEIRLSVFEILKFYEQFELYNILDFTRSIFPLIERAPSGIKTDFINDHLRILEDLKLSKVDPKTPEKGYLVPTTLMFVEALK
jgi:hypothetical protein